MMKERELREAATCAACGKKFGHTGLPLLWRVKIERLGVDIRAVHRQDGLAAMLENSYLANIMGPDEEMTIPLMEPVEITLCENCSHEPVYIGALAERAAKL